MTDNKKIKNLSLDSNKNSEIEKRITGRDKEFVEQTQQKDNAIQILIRRYMIVGERRISNYWWAFVISFGACGFLLTGVSSYLGFNLIPFFNSQLISFFPQGLLMSFYGSLGLLLSIYWWFLIFWNVGSGFNEFNKKDGFIRVFRWGYPGKNRRIDLTYAISNIQAIR